MEEVGFVVIQPEELLRIIPTVATILGVFPLCVFREEAEIDGNLGHDRPAPVRISNMNCGVQ